MYIFMRSKIPHAKNTGTSLITQYKNIRHTCSTYICNITGSIVIYKGKHTHIITFSNWQWKSSESWKVHTDTTIHRCGYHVYTAVQTWHKKLSKFTANSDIIIEIKINRANGGAICIARPFGMWKIDWYKFYNKLAQSCFYSKRKISHACCKYEKLHARFYKLYLWLKCTGWVKTLYLSVPWEMDQMW